MIKANHLLNICKENKLVYNSETAKQTAEYSAKYLNEMVKDYSDDYELRSIKPCKFDLEQSKVKVATVIRHDDWVGDPMDKWDVILCDRGVDGQYGLTHKDVCVIYSLMNIISIFEDASNFVPENPVEEK